MSRQCTVCTHKKTAAIDRALATRSGSIRAIAGQHGLSKESVRRHLHEHLPRTLALGHEAAESARADELLTQVKAMQSKTLNLLLKAEAAGDLRTALSGIREARGNIELLARLAGEIQEQPTVVNNYYIASNVRAAIIQALTPYPAARYAVADALAPLQLEEASLGGEP